jgi:very-short-patch-repair endonuclease/endogenous inhibitor of DNA gyrase (YacG/DUF329 family)
MGKKLTQQQFLDKVKKNIGEEYENYSFKETIYVNQRTKVKVNCKLHGDFFITAGHLMNQKNTGCPECHNKTKRKNTEQFIKKAQEVHGDENYDYSQTKYINNNTKVKIICPEHGMFYTRPGDFLLNKSRCPECGKENSAKKRASNTDFFIKKAKEIHGNKYDYSLVDYKNNHEKIKIICPIHGVFEQSPNSHLGGNGCIKCKNSKGEEKINSFLVSKSISFEKEKTFKNLKDERKLRYDFYIPSKNLLIEYQGSQHFKNVFGSKRKIWLKQKHHDWLKRKYAKDNGYKLLTIPYWNYNIINEILNGEI